MILLRPITSRLFTAPAAVKVVARQASKQAIKPAFAKSSLTASNGWADDFVDWLIKLPKPKPKIKPVFNPDEWVQQTLSKANQSKWVAPLIKTNESLAQKALGLMANGYAQLTRSVEPYLQNWRIVTRSQLDSLKPPIEQLYQARMRTARGMVRSSVVQGVVGTGLVGGKLILGIAPTAVGLPGIEAPLGVLIPMLSAGVSLMARSVFGLLEGRRELLNANQGLKQLLKLRQI